MPDAIRAVVTADDHQLPIRPRTAAIIAELVARQDRIEGIGKGSVEVRADFTGGSVTVSLKEVGISRRIDAA